MEMQNMGDPVRRAKIVAVVEHVLSDRPGDWRVSIIGSQANDRWLLGRMGFERSYVLEGTAGEHRPEAIRCFLGSWCRRFAAKVPSFA